MFGATRRLDYELEVGAVIREGRKTREGSGEGVSLSEADEWIFGVCLVNDWSGEFVFLSICLVSSHAFSHPERKKRGMLLAKSLS